MFKVGFEAGVGEPLDRCLRQMKGEGRSEKTRRIAKRSKRARRLCFEGVKSVKKTVLWTIFSDEVRNGFAVRTADCEAICYPTASAIKAENTVKMGCFSHSHTS